MPLVLGLEPMPGELGLLGVPMPVEPPMVPALPVCPQANCASAIAETAQKIREVFPSFFPIVKRS